MTLDIKIFYLFNNLAGNSRLVDYSIIFFSDYLQYVVVALFIALLFFSKKHAASEKLRIFWISAVSVLLSRGILTEIIRFFYNRPRPFQIYNVHQLVAENSHSFPSGHATFFFALAAAIYFFDKRWGSWFFLMALIMTASRVAAGVHYPTDIIGGMIIGIVSAYIVFKISLRWKK